MKYLGVVVSGTSAVLVTCTVVDEEIVVLDDSTWTLQKGARPAAYAKMFERVQNLVKDQGIGVTVIKASALGKGGIRQGHLDAAELRGVIQAAAASTSATVKTLKKAVLSRVHGTRKVDEYLADEKYWDEILSGTVRKGSREAAFLIVAEVSPE